MKHLLLGLLLITSVARADRIGNSGGAWICRHGESEIAQGMLVDLFEARSEFQLSIINQGISTSANEVYQDRKNWLARNYPVMSQKLAPYFDRVEKNLVVVDAALVIVDDTLFRTIPPNQTCGGAKWEFTQFANYTSYGRVLVRRDLWESPAIGAVDKAALMVHEAVYLMLREEFKDTDSNRARQITGLLFSTLEGSWMATKVNEVLKLPSAPIPTPEPPPSDVQSICTIKNVATGVMYIGRGMVALDAEYAAFSECAAQTSYQQSCDRSTVRCEPILRSTRRTVCLAKNNASGELYRGLGRNRLEAAYEAQAACQNHTTYAPSCIPDKCSE